MDTGQPFMHCAFLQFKQRAASAIASSALYPKHTSSKFAARTCGSCSRTGTLVITSIGTSILCIFYPADALILSASAF